MRISDWSSDVCSSDLHNGRFLILTNADGALDFKIVEAPLDAPGRENWRDLVAHRPGCLILALQLFKDYLFRLEREAVLPLTVVTAWGSEARRVGKECVLTCSSSCSQHH